MGIRECVAAGLLAAGLWSGAASAEVLVILRDPAGNQAFFTPTHAWLDFDSYVLTGTTEDIFPAAPTTSFTLNDGYFFASASDQKLPQTIPAQIPYNWPEQYIHFTGQAMDFDNEAAKSRFVPVKSFGDILSATMVVYHWCIDGSPIPLCNEDYSQVGRGDIFGPPMEIRISSSVPEPRTWAMLLIGFAGLGAVAARSKRKPLRSFHREQSLQAA